MTRTRMEERLERGEIVTFDTVLLSALTNDRDFLLKQRQQGSSHKNISYNPESNEVTGFAYQDAAQADRLRDVLAEFSRQASRWLGSLLPRYAEGWQADRASLRPEEEATRRLRLTARNDLLHFDAFPSRPTGGHRILRLYLNINPTDDRIWVTSDTFARVIEKYGHALGFPLRQTESWMQRMGQGIRTILQPSMPVRTEYDDFMLRLHHFLKSNDEFQERAPRKLWHFKPGTAWLLFADGIAHAELRGQFALEHSFFVPPDNLTLPDESPLALLERLRTSCLLPNAA